MAVFGAPLSDGSDCLNGVMAAREILARVEAEVAQGKVLPPGWVSVFTLEKP